MKSQIIFLFVLAVILAHCSSSAIKGRRYEKDNHSKARMFHKKGGQAPQIFLIEAAPQMSYPSAPIEFNLDGVFDVEEIESETETEDDARANFADNNEDDYDDDFIDVDNEQVSRRNKKRNSNLKLKKLTGKKEAQKKNAASSKKGVNKIRLIQLNDNSNVHSNGDNIGIRRLRLQKSD